MKRSKHICAHCGGEFTSKAKCWYHMDFECAKLKAALKKREEEKAAAK